jgi:ATP/maltotriose-dependent transcriptional regulator MalT
MKTLSAPRRSLPCGFTRFVFALFAIAVAVLACTASVQAQPSPGSTTRVDVLRSQIKSAEEGHAGGEQLGTLWLQLAGEYQERFELPQAEDAFTHSISLLRSAATQPGYAYSLDGLGWVYFATGRPADARNCFRRALEIYQALGDSAQVAKSHEKIAEVLFAEGRYREGEAESSEGLKELRSELQPDLVEMAAALLLHSYALCFQGRCTAALDEVNRAMTLAQSIFPANSFEISQVWMARGFDQWKSGSPDEGERSMREALRLLLDETDRPRQLLVIAQISALNWYADCLKANHHKLEARHVEAEILQLRSERQRPVCNGCTVNAVAFSH